MSRIRIECVALLAGSLLGKSDGSGCGCDYHPSTATHAWMAQVLEAAMKSALGW
jgi:hypothetical protein